MIEKFLSLPGARLCVYADGCRGKVFDRKQLGTENTWRVDGPLIVLGVEKTHKSRISF